MLYSHSEENEKLRQFVLFLNHAVNGREEYTQFVDNILIETHQFTVGEKTLYNIDRELFHIIVLLAKADNHYFSHLQTNPSHFDAQTYNKVLQMVNPSVKV